VSIPLKDLPKAVILEPTKGVRMEVEMETSACEIDLHLEKEGPGRSFVFMIAHPNGEVVQRVRIAGHAKVLFDPESPGQYVFLLTNPMTEAAVVRCEFTAIPGPSTSSTQSSSRGKGDRGSKPRRAPKDYDPAFR
jgi:hypothetical protein